MYYKKVTRVYPMRYLSTISSFKSIHFKWIVEHDLEVHN